MPYKPQSVLSEEQRTVGKRRYRWLKMTLIVYAVALVAVYVASSQHSTTVLYVALAVLFLSAMAYLVLLAWLASLLGKSVVVYVGGSILTSPIGYFVSFAFMQRAASRAALT